MTFDCSGNDRALLLVLLAVEQGVRFGAEHHHYGADTAAPTDQAHEREVDDCSQVLG